MIESTRIRVGCCIAVSVVYEGYILYTHSKIEQEFKDTGTYQEVVKGQRGAVSVQGRLVRFACLNVNRILRAFVKNGGSRGRDSHGRFSVVVWFDNFQDPRAHVAG